MKKMTLLVVGPSAFAAVLPRGGGFQRQTPEQRVAAIHAKLDSAFKLEQPKLAHSGYGPYCFIQKTG